VSKSGDGLAFYSSKIFSRVTTEVLTVTYWITKKDAEKHMATIEKIFSSVKSAE
jgi:hypothetical protein